MAHLRELTMQTCEHDGCSKIATHQLFGIRNDPYGRYCTKHAAIHLNRLRVDERPKENASK